MNDAPNESLVQGKNAWIQEMLRSPVSTRIPCSDFGLRLSITSSRLDCKQMEFCLLQENSGYLECSSVQVCIDGSNQSARQIQPAGPQDLRLLSRDSEGNETW